MKACRFLTLFLLVAGALSACGERSDVASSDCAELAKGKLSETQQVALAKKCPRAGPTFKPSPARNW
jgi:entry exclusion lipoprotein TrbK